MSSDVIRNPEQPSGIRVSLDASRERQTPKTDFGHVMKTGLVRGTDAVLNAGRLAAPFVPGGAIVAATITSVGGLKASAAGYSSGAGGSNATGLTMTSGSVVGTSGYNTGISSLGGTTPGGSGSSSAFNAVNASAAGGNSQAQLLVATREMQELNMSFNMQYLMMQQKMQSENRQFTLLSNIMKTKHDTAKNAISNVR
ncbi:MAG: hypothetical protein R3C68_10670 [Myxococcota bacterium]